MASRTVRVRLKSDQSADPVNLPTGVDNRVVVIRPGIRLQLKDSLGRVVADEACDIELPDGTVVRKKTDKEGRIRIVHDRHEGECTVSFPKRDGLTWKLRGEPQAEGD